MTHGAMSEVEGLRYATIPTKENAFSGIARGMQGSEVLRIAAEVRKLLAEGRPLCNLTVGDFDPRQFPVPVTLRDEAIAAFERGETNYPPSEGLPALREAIVAFVAREQGTAYPIESVLVASGVRPLMYAACRALLDPGDELVFGVPSWNMNHYAWLTQARPVPLVTVAEHAFHPTLDLIRPHLRSATVVHLCSPANPTGTMMSIGELERITAAIVEENQRRIVEGQRALFLLYDQVYGGLTHGTSGHANPVGLIPEVAPWTVCLDGISKMFAATGLRVGWSLAAPPVSVVMRDLLAHVGAWAPRPEQVATTKLLRDEPAIAAFRVAMDSGIKSRLDTLCEGFTALREVGYPVDWVRPEGAIYLSIRLDLVGRTIDGRPITTNEDIRYLLLEQAGFAVVPFQAFGLEAETGWFRASVGAVSLGDIGDAFPRIQALLDCCQSSVPEAT